MKKQCFSVISCLSSILSEYKTNQITFCSPLNNYGVLFNISYSRRFVYGFQNGGISCLLRRREERKNNEERKKKQMELNESSKIND